MMRYEEHNGSSAEAGPPVQTHLGLELIIAERRATVLVKESLHLWPLAFQA